ERGPIDLVLMDVQMPDMDGLEATAFIREREKETGAHVPIIGLTAHAIKGDRERCQQAGMDGYVTKPVQFRELLDAIAGLVPSPPAGPAGEAVETRPTQVCDWARSLRRVGGDKELLKGLVDDFVAGCPKLLSEIRRAVRGRDAEALERKAHALKGLVGYFHAEPAMDAARQLEAMAHEAKLDGAEEASNALQQEIGGLLLVLRDGNQKTDG